MAKELSARLDGGSTTAPLSLEEAIKRAIAAEARADQEKQRADKADAVAEELRQTAQEAIKLIEGSMTKLVQAQEQAAAHRARADQAEERAGLQVGSTCAAQARHAYACMQELRADQAEARLRGI